MAASLIVLKFTTVNLAQGPPDSRVPSTDAPGVGVLVRTVSPILLAYSVPSGADGSLVRTAAAALAFPVAGGVWNVNAAEAVAEGA